MKYLEGILFFSLCVSFRTNSIRLFDRLYIFLIDLRGISFGQLWSLITLKCLVFDQIFEDKNSLLYVSVFLLRRKSFDVCTRERFAVGDCHSITHFIAFTIEILLVGNKKSTDSFLLNHTKTLKNPLVNRSVIFLSFNVNNKSMIALMHC